MVVMLGASTAESVRTKMIYYDEKHRKQVHRDAWVFGICLVMMGVGVGMVLGVLIIEMYGKGWF